MNPLRKPSCMQAWLLPKMSSFAFSPDCGCTTPATRLLARAPEWFKRLNTREIRNRIRLVEPKPRREVSRSDSLLQVTASRSETMWGRP